ncbi:hypothetical protein HMPREF1487_09406 [Pseudomonas sp. HPB0071]|uniref:hypothetical protein n=1 Tax=Pseudomonas sp. HPB0071 TaxID=1203578 RepID=UPI0002C98100|nr:hypothetical protein [Pseudomonas sp. HPB0071]ENA26927.1 hypothetical protein HMPREF1487_09406 [Pseudomonas sp. HPB0071]
MATTPNDTCISICERASVSYATEAKGDKGFWEILDAYRLILEANPGKALHLGDDCYAFIDLEGHLLNCAEDINGRPDLVNASDFSSTAWNDELNCWDCDAGPSETMRHIQNPTLVALLKSCGSCNADLKPEQNARCDSCL